MLASRKLKSKLNKNKSKRQRTFTSSELSLNNDRVQQSLSELFRNEAFKRKPLTNPNTNINPIPAPVKQRSQKQLNCTKKRGKSKSKTRLDRCETYQVIPYKNSFKSDIVFSSNQDTKRQGWEGSHDLGIQLNEKYLIDNNNLLRISIRREYQRKVEAAVKIQKVFRGYLTRKVLQNCMDNEQKRLQQSLRQIKSKPVSGSISQHSSYFAEKENISGESHRRRAVDQQCLLDSFQDSSSSDDEAVYRHHEAIYSHEQIGEFGSSEEEDFDQDAFDGNIIFQTNEEYIDSRKSSQQPQPKNKISRPSPLPIAEEGDDQAEVLVKTEKKQEWTKGGLMIEQIREATIKLNEQSKMSQKESLFEGQAQATLKGVLESERVEVQKLKQEEVSRWDEIIGLVQSQMSRQVNHSQFGSFMQQLMELSIKNKQSLELGSPKKAQRSLPRLDSKGKLKNLKLDRHYLEDHHQNTSEERIKEASKESICEIVCTMPTSVVANKSEIREENVLQRSSQLKRLLSQSSSEPIEEMLQIREDLVKKREVEEMRKLNIDLESKSISQQIFLDRLQAIQEKYAQQKALLQLARNDIARGQQAALKLAQQAVNDAKKLGYDLQTSRSAGTLKAKFPLSNQLLIDELSQSRKEDRIRPVLARPPLMRSEEPVHITLSSDAQSSDLEFNEDQLWRYRRAQPDLELAGEIADMGRNVMISEELLRQQQAEESLENQLMATQQISREIYQIEETSPPRCTPQVERLTDWLAATLLWETAGQLLLRPLFAERLLDRKEPTKPTAVTDSQRLHFLSLLQQNFPSVEVLNNKLNQKICPLPGELLRCMRIDFSQQQDEDSYEEIGKYEFIIGQEVCNQTIKQFREFVDASAPVRKLNLQEIQELSKQYLINEKVVRYVSQREKYLTNRCNHTRELRWEVLNIEIHCIFDSWNEELIAIRSQKAGYSGIGLNQLTLSVHDHNSIVPYSETLRLITQGRKRLIRTLSLSSPILVFPAAVEEEEELLEADSRWIFYADEALSYGLELVYLVEQELFTEMAKEIRKRILQL